MSREKVAEMVLATSTPVAAAAGVVWVTVGAGGGWAQVLKPNDTAAARAVPSAAVTAVVRLAV